MLTNILGAWKLGEDLLIEEINQGYMNKTYRVQTPQHLYIIRIYESESDLSRVSRENKILNYLNSRQLSFGVPTFLNNQYGDYYYETENGAIAILMPCLKGKSPDLSNPQQAFVAGKALGEINTLLAGLEVKFYKSGDRNPSYAQYRRFHPCIKHVEDTINALPTTELKINGLLKLFSLLEEGVESVYRQLPKQYIHGDYTPGNLLFENGRITGMIDFEFLCYDARLMDLATALGGGPTALWEYDPELNNIKMLVKGYAHFYKLSEQEIQCIPFLILLRRAAMFVYFCARYVNGYDDSGWIRGIVDWVLDCESWLQENKERFLDRVREGMIGE